MKWAADVGVLDVDGVALDEGADGELGVAVAGGGVEEAVEVVVEVLEVVGVLVAGGGLLEGGEAAKHADVEVVELGAVQAGEAGEQ